MLPPGRASLHLTAADRIDALGNHDRHGAGRLLQGGRGRTDTAHEYVRAERHQLPASFAAAPCRRSLQRTSIRTLRADNPACLL